jgi:hypothetical protein
VLEPSISICGQGGSFGFPLINQVYEAQHNVMVSQDDYWSADGEIPARGLFGALRLVVEQQARRDGDIETQRAVAHAVIGIDTTYGNTSC